MGREETGIVNSYPHSGLKRNVLAMASVFFIFTACSAFSQEAGQEAGKEQPPAVTAQDMQKAFEQAMKKVDSERAEKEKVETDKVRAVFDDAANKWLGATKDKESSAIGKFIKQDWENLAKIEYFVRFNPQTASLDPFVHYDYSLREFEFVEKARDIIKSNALLAPYKGYIDVVEKRYVERYHTPDISYIDAFIFTVTTPIRANFEYRDNAFVLIGVDNSKDVMERGWPQKVRDRQRVKI